AAGQDSALALESGRTLVFRLNGQVVASAPQPATLPEARVLTQASGCVVVGPGQLREAALFRDRIEYTCEMRLDPPHQPWTILSMPLAPGATVSVVHGTTEKDPQTSVLHAGGLSAASDLSQLRYLTVRSHLASFAVDIQPEGANGVSRDNWTALSHIARLRPSADTLDLIVSLAGARAQFPCGLSFKIILYAPPRPFEQVHPFVLMNYRYAYEKVRKFDFTGAPMPKKASEPRSVARTAYRKKTGWGWTRGADAVEIEENGVSAPLNSQGATSPRPAAFRVDLPPGHYYLTLNTGSATQPTGPMRVIVNGEERLPRLALDKGRFKAEILWVTSRQDHIEIAFEGLDGKPWRVNALTVSALSTLEEDFALTRKWRHLDAGAPAKGTQ
ncbi:MAG TPA: hypothetical protein P5137_09165, partial [Candidatus Brocadiia bacterium]|nr:hypothetical protein [Candidatus Brocadiia bacterium]